MSGLFKKAVPAALFMVLGLTLNHANGASVNLKGGDPATLGGWQIGLDANVNANGVSIVGDTLLIQNEAITFTDNGSKGISFTQVSADAVPFIEIATNTAGNSTGTNWTAFAFTLSGNVASFDGISSIFAPPLSSGVNYDTADLNPARTSVTYTGSQLNGSTSNWGSTTPNDELLVDGNPTTGTPFTSFTMDESPQGFVSEVVSVPAAAWQCLAGLLALGFIPTVRKAKKVFA